MSPATIVVSGALANKPFNGGEAWVRMSWASGFRKLGFRVVFIEQIDPTLLGNDDRVTNYFRQVTRRFGFAESSALIGNDGRTIVGIRERELLDVAHNSQLLVNISGHLNQSQLMVRFRRKAYVDIDPGFTQFWHAQGHAGARLEGHDVYFTIGENIGAAECSIPTAGIQWKPARQPVVLEDWPVTDEGDSARFTTVASWRGAFGPISSDERTYGLKAHAFRKFIELPRRASQKFEIALDIHPNDRKDLHALKENGWSICDPKSVATDPDAFRNYVQQSGGEFSVAQGIYVETNSGWFSDRTIRYLASGKPALVQETGFSKNISTGRGLLSFSTMAEAIEASDEIANNYASHCRAARAIAEQYFDSNRVLRQFLAQARVAA